MNNKKNHSFTNNFLAKANNSIIQNQKDSAHKDANRSKNSFILMNHSYYNNTNKEVEPYSKLVLPPMKKETMNHNEFSTKSNNFRDNLDEIKERRRSSFSSNLESKASCVKLKSKIPNGKISNLSLATRNKSQIPSMKGLGADKEKVKSTTGFTNLTMLGAESQSPTCLRNNLLISPSAFSNLFKEDRDNFSTTIPNPLKNYLNMKFIQEKKKNCKENKKLEKMIDLTKPCANRSKIEKSINDFCPYCGELRCLKRNIAHSKEFVDTKMQSSNLRTNKMLRIMRIIDKDYKDKCSNFRDKETMQMTKVQAKRTKNVEMVMKTKKEILFNSQIKYGNLQPSQTSATPVSNIISKIRQERIEDVINCKYSST